MSEKRMNEKGKGGMRRVAAVEVFGFVLFGWKGG